MIDTESIEVVLVTTFCRTEKSNEPLKVLDRKNSKLPNDVPT